MLTEPKLTRAARLLAAGRLEHAALDRLPDGLQPTDEDAAYRLQEALHDHLTAAGLGRVVGYKIGCTTPVMQSFLGIGSPCSGAIFGTTVVEGTTLPRRAFRRPGVECEIAVRLGRDLPATEAPFTASAVAAGVAACMAAIEIVDDRYRDYEAAGAPLLIADDFFGAGCVLGEPIAGWRDLDLAAVRGTMTINGAPAGAGCGADVLGHPLEALAWLANALARRGQRLGAGQIVLTGSMVATRWVEAGDTVDVALDGLGTVRAEFV